MVFYNQYGIATGEEIIENMAKLLDNWSPHKGTEKLINRFDKSVTYASYAGQATVSNTIVTYVLPHGHPENRKVLARVRRLARP